MRIESKGVAMKSCPYCFGEIADDARKCKHCGEWVVKPEITADKGPGEPVSTGTFARFFAGRRLDETLNEGVKLYAKFNIIGGVIALVLFLIMLFTVIIPAFSDSPGFP